MNFTRHKYSRRSTDLSGAYSDDDWIWWLILGISLSPIALALIIVFFLCVFIYAVSQEIAWQWGRRMETLGREYRE